jgi:uncharacterized membrane protein
LILLQQPRLTRIPLILLILLLYTVGMERVSRSVVKSITFRIIILVADGVVVYFFTRKLELALGIVLVRNAIAMVLYFLHERTWEKINWGRIKK